MSYPRYIEFDSTYRNRNLYPLPSDFSISSDLQKTDYKTALDPVALTIPFFAWTPRLFDITLSLPPLFGDINLNPTISGILEPSNTLANLLPNTDDNFYIVLNATTNTDSYGILYPQKFQELENYYVGACVVVTDTSTNTQITRRIDKYRYLGQTTNGFNGAVKAMAVDLSENIYVGGSFTSPFKYLAMWNGTAWTGVNGGLNGVCNAIAIDSSDVVYIGGDFTDAGGVPVNNIVMWDGSNFFNLNGGLTLGIATVCNTIAIDSSNIVYVGGDFTDAGGVTVSNIAMWDGSNFFDLNGGLDGPCNTIFIETSTSIYVGGAFTYAVTIPVLCNNIANWDGMNWSDLTDSVTGITGLNGICISIGTSGSELLIGGNFTDAGGHTVSNIVRWIPSIPEFSTNLLGTGLNGPCYVIKDGYIGGNFTDAGGNSVNNFAIWDAGGGWNIIFPVDGTNGPVYSIGINYIPTTDRIYIGGDFTKNSTNKITLNYFAHISPSGIITNWFSPGVYDRAVVEFYSPLPDFLQINSLNYTFSITDPSDFSDPSYPLLFVPNGINQQDAYNKYYIFNEYSQEYRRIAGYNEITHLLKLDCLNNPIIVPFPWSITDSYSLRREIPVFPSAGFDDFPYQMAGYPNTLTTMYFELSQFSKSYVNNWLRLPPVQYYFLDIPITAPTIQQNNNGYAQIVKVLSVEVVTGAPFITTGYKVTITPLKYVVHQGHCEISQFSYDNAYPLDYYSGDLKTSVYKMELLNLILPNLTLKSGYGGRIAFYPYVYVIIYNSTSSTGLKNILLSNNPNSVNAVFRCPVNDISLQEYSPFIKLDGNRMSQYFTFLPYGTLAFQVLLPNGDLYETVEQDYYSPCEPNFKVQVSAVFRIQKYEPAPSAPPTTITIKKQPTQPPIARGLGGTIAPTTQPPTQPPTYGTFLFDNPVNTIYRRKC